MAWAEVVTLEFDIYQDYTNTTGRIITKLGGNFDGSGKKESRNFNLSLPLINYWRFYFFDIFTDFPAD